MNLRTTLGSKLLCSLILCLWIFLPTQSAQAGPLLAGSGFGEKQDAFQVLVKHGAVAAPGDLHIIVPAAPGAMFWDFQIRITGMDGGGASDLVTVTIMPQHLVGVMGHTGEGKNIVLAFSVSAIGPFAPGVKNNRFSNAAIQHPPNAGHIDLFNATLTFTVAMDGVSITDYTLEVTGKHCSPECPALPPIDKSLKEVPEWNALILFGSGLAGFLGYGWRRKNVLLRQRKRP